MSFNYGLPTTLLEYFRYVYRQSPGIWRLFLIQDIIHDGRMPVAYLIVGMIVDKITLIQSGSPPDRMYSEITILIMILGGFLFIAEAAHVWTAYIMIKWKPWLRAKVRSEFFDYALGHSHAYLADNLSGSLTRKITELGESTARLHDVIRFQIFLPLVVITVSAIVLSFSSPVFSFVLFVFALSVILPVIIRAGKIADRSKIHSDKRAGTTGCIVDSFTNSHAVKSFGRESHEIETHDKTAEHEKKASSKLILSIVQVENYRRLCLVILMTGMMALCVYTWHIGWITVGEIATIMGVTFSMLPMAWMMGFGILQFIEETGSVKDALTITSKIHGLSDEPDAPDLAVKDADVELRNVTFRYAENRVFENLSLHIPAKQKVGLVGRSGAGKSTFVNLLLRFYDVEKGAVLIDSQDIAKVTQKSLRNAIAVIPQDSPLFHRSVAENIRYGRLEATDEEVMAAARTANAHDFIKDLPEGYDTVVGERGVKLSGGQRQRIAIARAILKDAPILVLDEATSSLDSESENAIQDALVRIMKNKTVIAIAHRLSTISHLDRILVFDNGIIAEDGDHENLIKTGGLYAHLWSMQTNGFLNMNSEKKIAFS